MTRLKRLAPCGCPTLDLSPVACHGRRHDFIEACCCARHGFVWRPPNHQRQPENGDRKMMIAVGVDTHKHEHLAVAVDALGQLLAEITIPATLAGYRELLAWITGLEGEVRVGIEGAGSYGAGLCEYLQDNAITGFEGERPNRRERRIGKTYHLYALLAAKKALYND